MWQFVAQIDDLWDLPAHTQRQVIFVLLLPLVSFLLLLSVGFFCTPILLSLHHMDLIGVLSLLHPVFRLGSTTSQRSSTQADSVPSSLPFRLWFSRVCFEKNMEEWYNVKESEVRRLLSGASGLLEVAGGSLHSALERIYPGQQF